ncbi:MAG: hypothetical protein OEU46_22890 [Alphaproteobacteria bacterium]|nr:hypothetical protein [Alphaproteobacteria bacterium]
MQEVQERTPEVARAEIDALPLDGELLSILQDPAHPGHKAATAKRRALYDAAYPAQTGPDKQRNGDITGNAVNKDPAGGSIFDAPSSPQAYRFDATPPKLSHDADLDRKARGWFYEAGVPPWLANNIVIEWNRAAASPADPDRSDADAATAEAALRRHWGAAYESKIAMANSVLQSIGNAEIFDLLNRSGLANSDYLIRQLAALAESREGRQPGR